MGASFLFAALVFLGGTVGADRAGSAANALRLRTMIAHNPPGQVYRIAPRGNAMAPVYSLGQPLLLNPYWGVCFTMRTYKVKSTGEWQDAFNGMRGYSTCQMGSDYSIRDAVTPASK